jgi:hypothetical protein
MKVEVIRNNENVEFQEFEVGKLYKSENGRIILCTDVGDTNFHGVIIYEENEHYYKGHYTAYWAKDFFTPFSGTIKITQ